VFRRTLTLKARLPDWASRYTLANILVVNGQVTLENPTDSGFTQLRLTGGIYGGGTLVVEGGDQIEFGERVAYVADYPVFGGEIVFGEENAASGQVIFTNMVKFARIPVGDQYNFSRLRDFALAISDEQTFDSVQFGGRIPSSIVVNPGGRLTLTGNSAYDTISVADGGVLVLAQDSTIRDIRGGGTLVAQDGVTVKLEYTDRSLHLQTEGTGRFELADPAALIERDFSDDISLWFDASVGESLVGYRSRKSGETTLPDNYTHYTNGYPIIEKWLDRRVSQRTWCAFNARHFKYDVNAHMPNLYPYVVSNGLNGLNYVSCGGYGQTLTEEWTGNIGNSATESRRLPFTYFDESRITDIHPVEQSARYIVMVLGSQQGGGSQIIGRSSASAFARSGQTLADPIMQNPNYPTWVDSKSVNASTTRLNGDWQVISIDCTENKVVLAGLGWGTSGVSNSGGQNYAEVLIFSNALTTVARERIERYLARKWGLEEYPEGGTRQLVLTGTGSVAISNETVVVGGTFTGSLEAGGGKVKLAPLPPDETAIAATTPLHWFDPSARDSMILSKDVVPASIRPDCVWGLFDRRAELRQANDYYLYAPADQKEATSPTISMDRRPRCVARETGGVATNWLDYANGIGYGDTWGNTLRLGRLNTADTMWHGNNHNASGNNQAATSIRTGFIVQDSSRGGGVPFADSIGVTELVQQRANLNNFNSAIYASGTTTLLKSGRVWLNGNPVNPVTAGFTGAPEVFTFEATNDFPLLNFAYYGGDGGAYKGGQEIQSEILLYDTVLPTAVRRQIEAYLTYKWMGRFVDGYGDWRRQNMTFQGVGSVILPATNLVFMANGNARTLSPTYDFGTLSVEGGTGVFTVDISKGLAPGVYTLARGSGLAVFDSWTVALVGGTTSLQLQLLVTPSEISLKAYASGTLMMLQ